MTVEKRRPGYAPQKRQGDAPGLLWLFFGFAGRIARQSYALSILFQFILFCLSVYWAVAAGEDQSRLTLAGFAFIGVAFFNLWSGVALSVKRLNDLNLPWPLALFIFVPGVNVLMILFLAVRESYPVTNRHGPPPFGSDGDSEDGGGSADISENPPPGSTRFGR